MPARPKDPAERWDRKHSQVFTYLPSNLKEWIEEKAHTDRVSVSRYLERLVRNEYERQGGS
jgi:hypothetical protein